MRPRFLFLVFLVLVISAPMAHAQDRGGFTFIMTLGYGLQSGGEIKVGDYYGSGNARTYGGGTYSSLAGLNLGIGGFVAKDTALMLRLSGTDFTAKYLDEGYSENETDVVSGVAVLGVQHWATDRFNWEAGAGYGIFSWEDHDEMGVGFMLGAAYSFYQNGKVNLQLGIEDALVTGHAQTVNSLGFCFGFQVM